jgi:hypothetical protein
MEATMSRRSDPRFILALAVLLSAVGLVGCDDEGDPDLTRPGDAAQVQASVEASAGAAALSAPPAGAAGDMVLGMMQTLGGAGLVDSPASCPESFDLGNGITGTCSVSETGVITFTFGGTVELDGAPVTFEGTLVATPAPVQPPVGTRYSLDFDATASGPRGDLTLTGSGTITLDGSGQILEFDFDLTIRLNPAGGSTVTVAVVISDSALELTITGPHGNVVKCRLDPGTLSGTILVNGSPVAQVTIVDGCAEVDYLDASLDDATFCAAS